MSFFLFRVDQCFFLVPAFSRLERSLALIFSFNKQCSAIQKSKFLLWARPAHEKGTVGRLERRWRFGLQSTAAEIAAAWLESAFAFSAFAFCLSFARPILYPRCSANVLKKPETTTGSAVVVQRKTGRGDVVQRKRKTFVPFLFSK